MKLVIKPVLELTLTYADKDTRDDREGFWDTLTEKLHGQGLKVEFMHRVGNTLQLRVDSNDRNSGVVLDKLRVAQSLSIPLAVSQVRRHARARKGAAPAQ